MRYTLPKFVLLDAAASARLAVLVILATLVWCWHYEKWTAASWNLPTDYSGDSFEVLARIRAAAEGDTVPLGSQVISRLGAPFGANWNAYPASDLPLIWLIGAATRVIGFYPAVNLALLLATVSSAVSFYYCARWLRWRWEWSMGAALVFAFTFQTFTRGLAHFTLVFSWTVPLALVSCALIAASRRVEMRRRGGLFCLFSAAVLGLSNPYNLFFYLQLLGWALVIQLIGPRRRENIRLAVAALAVAILGFVISEFPTWVYPTDSAAVSPLVRNYGSTERYALKPLELFLPPNVHRFDDLAFFGHRYLRWSDWRGEAFSPYLGLIGIAALLALAAETFVCALRRRRLPGAALPAFWVVAYASIGGVTNILAFFSGLHLFRATNRFSIFLSAIVLLFLTSRLSRLTFAWPSWSRAAVAALLALVGIWDQVPRRATEAERSHIARAIEADRKFGDSLEKRLGQGAMVFQFPVLVFPEAQTPHRLGDYEHFRPYVTTETLRFSYGALKGRARGRWQRELNSATAAELTRRLERYGFSGLYINRKGFADHGDKLLEELAALGRTERIEHELGNQVLVILRPGSRTELPVATGLTFGHGWHSAAHGNILSLPRWSWSGEAALSYFNPYSYTADSTIKLRLSGTGSDEVRIYLNGQLCFTTNVAAEPCDVLLTDISLRPGANRVDLKCARSPVRLSQERGQLRSFALHQSEVTLLAEPFVTAGK